MPSSKLASTLALTLFAVLAAGEGKAVVFNVSTIADGLDFVACTPQTPNACSLRSAVIWANQLPGVDTIQLSPGTYTLGLFGTEPTILSNPTTVNDIDITDSLIVRGAGIQSTIVDGAGLSRVFDVHDMKGINQRVVFENMTLRNGRINAYEGMGAAIRAFHSQFAGEAEDKDELIVDRVRMTGNMLFGEGISGAALHVDSADAWVLNSEIDHNTHVAVKGSSAAIMGFWDTRSVVVQNTRIHDNTLGPDKSGVMIGFVGVDKAWWDRNEVTKNDGAEQLVVYSEGDTLLVTNSTFSGNDGAVIGSRGKVQLLHATITDNNESVLREGVVMNWGLGTIHMKNSIIAKQVAGKNCTATGFAEFVSLGNNIDSDGSCFLTAPGDNPSTDPKLGALQANGGTTRNHMPLAGSPAIDAGQSLAEVPIDQRGISRPIGQAADIGAVERNILVPSFPRAPGASLRRVY